MTPKEIGRSELCETTFDYNHYYGTTNGSNGSSSSCILSPTSTIISSIVSSSSSSSSCSSSSESDSSPETYSKTYQKGSGFDDWPTEEGGFGARKRLSKRKSGLHQQLHQRHAANLRERKRMQSINDAFEVRLFFYLKT